MTNYILDRQRTAPMKNQIPGFPTSRSSGLSRHICLFYLLIIVTFADDLCPESTVALHLLRRKQIIHFFHKFACGIYRFNIFTDKKIYKETEKKDNEANMEKFIEKLFPDRQSKILFEKRVRNIR
ncbi:Deoxyuridine 5'-triphosphate nucleotidohydrolase [Dirofilaria immitis]